MAVQDIRSNLISQFLGSVTPTNNNVITFLETAPDGVIDTAAFELGVMFSVRAVSLSSGSPTSVTLLLQETDNEDATSDFTTITNTDALIGTGLITNATTLVPDGDNTDLVIKEARMATLGVISNKRFLQVGIAQDGGTADGVFEVYAIQKAEIMPTIESDEPTA